MKTGSSRLQIITHRETVTNAVQSLLRELRGKADNLGSLRVRYLLHVHELAGMDDAELKRYESLCTQLKNHRLFNNRASRC